MLPGSGLIWGRLAKLPDATQKSGSARNASYAWRALVELPHSKGLTALAPNLGFSSHSHFSFTFRRAFGCIPSWFRMQPEAMNVRDRDRSKRAREGGSAAASHMVSARTAGGRW